ncbi:hypothetical protein [Qipengyuania huizhouensis]|uniref:hypothetical protein n=1 Tax=Qipengyuania huizhouensis TaxID=2867245 RepID=UPI0017ECC695|nr:hypothetical protein [Qipengyuania huizhouensis]MBA4765312.1 hypothetical protein [Erythrobacter sp.]MBX7461073.1 hypothetical protein [Qipengyuania huizhouensis]
MEKKLIDLKAFASKLPPEHDKLKKAVRDGQISILFTLIHQLRSFFDRAFAERMIEHFMQASALVAVQSEDW